MEEIHPGCTLAAECRPMVKTDSKILCSFCYEYCHSAENLNIISILKDTAATQKCECSFKDHIEGPDFFEPKIVDHLKTLSNANLNLMGTWNLFFGCARDGKSLLEIVDPEVLGFVSKDYEALRKQTFRWEDIEISTINKRYEFVAIFLATMDPVRLNLLNTAPFEQAFPLKFLDAITERPDYSFGQQIYNSSLSYYTNLLDFFCKFYLEKDFQMLDKIDAQDIETLTPICRYKIREKNRNNPLIREKYFNDEFNVHKFALKLVEKFIPGASWRWIGGTHKAHIFSVKIVKLLVEYGMFDETEFDDIKHALYLKVQILKSLESIIDRDSKTISDYWVGIWTDGMKQVREYYCEILIHLVYQKQDNELIKMIQNYVREDTGIGKLNEKRLDQILSFNRSIIFEEEFGRKIMDFILGYVLAQNKIKNKLLNTDKIQKITDNFLHIFSNVEDPYLKSMRLMTDQEIRDFCSNVDVSTILKSIKGINNELLRILANVSQNFYYRNQTQAVLDFESKVLDALDASMNIYNEHTFSYTNQEILHQFTLPWKILNFTCLYLEELKASVDIGKRFFLKVCKILIYFLKDNCDNHCTIQQEYYFSILNKLFEGFPEETVEFILTVYKPFRYILLANENLSIKFFIDWHKSMHEKLKAEDGETALNYRIMYKILELQKLFLDLTTYTNKNYLPEYDLLIANELIPYDQFLDLPMLKDLLKKVTDGSEILSELEIAKTDYMINFLDILQLSLQSRYTHEVYQPFEQKFTLDNLKELLNLAKENMSWRTSILELIDCLHVDFKNHLLNQRQKYFHTSPADLQYEEDTYAEKDYEKIFKIVQEEIDFILNLFRTKPANLADFNFSDYCNNSVLSIILKAMNYFFMLREQDLNKISKLLAPMKDLYAFLTERLDLIRMVYRVREPIVLETSKAWLETEMAKIEQVKKRENFEISGICQCLHELVSKIMKNSVLSRKKKTLIAIKDPLKRVLHSFQVAQTFSNRLEVRKENLDMPFKIIKKELLKNKSTTKITIVEYFIAYYQHFKMTKMSTESANNIYLKSLEQEESSEMQQICFHLCSFIHNELTKDVKPYKKNYFFMLIESLCNTLFIATTAVQKNLYKAMNNGESLEVMNKIWHEMIETMRFVRYKTSIDKVWKQGFKRVLLLLRFHQFLNEDNNTLFKNFFREKTISTDHIDRVQRFTTIFQKLTDQTEFHKNYVPNTLTTFTKSHRIHLYPIVVLVFECLSELTTGPCKENQKKIYTFIYDRYNGLLKRYVKDPNSDYYKMKVALLEFIMSMAEGLDEDVVTYQTINFELNTVNSILINSLKQLFNEIALPENLRIQANLITDYKLAMKDYSALMKAFESNESFNKSPLLEICIKLYTYIRLISTKRNKFEIFCKERDEAILEYSKHKSITNKIIKEDDLVSYKFLSQICGRIEIRREKSHALEPFYFQVLPKCSYLSDKSKENFLKEADRTNDVSKIYSLINKIKFFEIEMDHNENQYYKNPLIYSLFGSGNTFYFEVFTLLVSIVINVILLSNFRANDKVNRYDGEYDGVVVALSIVEIVMSVIPMFAWIMLKYTLEIRLQIQMYMDNNAEKKSLSFRDKVFVYLYLALFTQTEVFPFIYHIVCILLALLITPGFYGIDLLSLVNLSKTLKYVIRSTTEHGSQLGATYLLGLIIMYAYSIFVHVYFAEAFAHLDSTQVIRMTTATETECGTLVQCFWTIINKAFRNGEGVGPIMMNESYSENNYNLFYARLFLDITFFLIVNVVLLNIIFGIIIDTFAELRTKQQKFDEDSEKFCFICNLERYQFEKAGIEFETHCKEEHNIWDYVNFLVFMKKKTPKDCNGIESELLKNIKDGDIVWVPLHRSISLEKNQKFVKEEPSFSDLKDYLESLKVQMDDILSVVKEKPKSD